ncbi:30S ribosomal protein S19 [Candidatus Parcubacteria bacterium]|nr:30S ribosomal protein S19 [Patescibacteria group bacterium]MBU4309500.1 30S ribosomal protein S19 [Patescibacteria group bacterium]MBU4432068.1 30S ribosomal protein S19 [Patescibacteria group bacterium]MBU4577206.1 30S ribosomal protein S19 [Patescibacteria group bacterium]MCG2696853.1 30S ribosomal protein S19 [Candidatus Parcubacteria bacterium]
MSRSLKKGPYINQRFLNKIKNLKPGEKTNLRLWDRSCSITPEMVGFTVGVHNGRKHVDVYVVEDMVGHKFGEFAPTRKFVNHGGKMAKVKK